SADGVLEAEKAHFFAPLACEEVDAVDEAHPVAPGAHQERMGTRAVGEEAYAAEEVPVRHAGRRDDHLARREVLGAEHRGVVVDSDLAQLVDLATGRRPELRLQLPAEAAQRSRG